MTDEKWATLPNMIKYQVMVNLADQHTQKIAWVPPWAIDLLVEMRTKQGEEAVMAKLQQWKKDGKIGS